MTTNAPSGLVELVSVYAGREQGSVAYSAARWSSKLAPVLQVERTLQALTDPASASVGTRDRYTTSRERIVDALCSSDLSAEHLMDMFLLTMAWGSGIRIPPWRFSQVAGAVEDRGRLDDALRGSLEGLRSGGSLDLDVVATVADGWSIPGIGQAFYSKWFAFAGYVPQRSWQPLILDARVRRTLAQSLNAPLGEYTGTRYQSGEQYGAYVRLLHDWSNALPESAPATAERLEWILFEHNGAALPSAGSS